MLSGAWAVWVALGGNVAFLAVLAFLGKSVVTQWLNKDLEQFKRDIRITADTELERLRSSLQLAANEHSILLTRLQDKRAEIIDQLYGRLAIAIAGSKDFIASDWLQGTAAEPTAKQLEHYKRAMEACDAFRDYFDQKRIWLPDECCTSVETLQTAILDAFNNFILAFSLSGPQSRNGKKAMAKAWDDIREDLVPPARAALELEMRKLLEPQRVGHK